jgi:hypothetical protein
MTFPLPRLRPHLPSPKGHPTAGDRFLGVGVLCIYTTFLVSAGILGWQIITWLKTGVWPAMPTGDYLCTTQIFGLPLLSDQACAWIAQPDSWQGLHRIVVGFLGFPLWLSTFMVGVGLMWVLVKVLED